jgi:hypothetical protein
VANAWNSFLDTLSKVVIPDWGALVGMMPLFVFLAVGGVLTLIVVLWAWHTIRQPHGRPRVVEGPYRAETDYQGRPIFPRGLPHCRADALVYPPGATRCDDGHDLTVDCPMCGLARDASIDTCGNCGLVLRVNRRERFARPAGPPPGGAAVA